MSDRTTIILGKRSFVVEEFTFDQLKRLLDVFEDAQKPLKEGGFEAARTILKEALSGQVEEKEFASLKATIPQIIAAVRIIGFASGLLVPGEAPAPVEKASA